MCSIKSASAVVRVAGHAEVDVPTIISSALGLIVVPLTMYVSAAENFKAAIVGGNANRLIVNCKDALIIGDYVEDCFLRFAVYNQFTISGLKNGANINGGSGNDVFIYKPGKDTDKIFDYASGDMLKIFTLTAENFFSAKIGLQNLMRH